MSKFETAMHATEPGATKLIEDVIEFDDGGGTDDVN